MPGILGGLKKAAKMEIAWRNPNPRRLRRTWQRFEQTSERALYILQEFVEDGKTGHWTPVSGLEVVPGGRVA